MLTYGSVCSGIEAASVAWEPLGWKPAWFAEIEPFPCAVLAHHWPHVTNLGDMTKIAEQVANDNVPAPDVLVGGTPCQAFSVAGARKGLADDRGFLTIKYVELADAIDERRTAAGDVPCITVWENVPGVLSSKDNAFGAFLGLLAGEDCELQPPGRKWENAGYVRGPKRAIAWRVLDAQYFGVAQRRRRVFVVASAREGFDPTEILFEREGVRRDTPPSREAGKAVAALTENGVGTCGADDNQARAGHLTVAFGQNNTSGPVHVSHALNAHSGPHGRLDFESETFLVQSAHGTQEPTPINLQVIVRHESLGRATGFGLGEAGEAAYTLGANHMHGIWHGLAVRRFTPVECERLQGFPDGHTDVPYRGKPAADGPRYKAIGNSMARPCMEWLGRRIEAVLRALDPANDNNKQDTDKVAV